MRRLLVLLVTALVALVVVGCGGDDSPSSKGSSKDEYKTQVQDAGRSLQQALAAISDQAGDTATPAKLGAALDQGATALDQTRKRLDGITPPSDAQAAHDKLVAGFGELTDAFRATADAARENDTAALNKALQGLSAGEGVQKISEAQKELKALGIEFSQQ